jgi:hypothetical protein
MQAPHYTGAAQRPAILAQRIVIHDGAMGTMIQRFKLAHPLGESAMHPPAPRSGRHAALFLLAGSTGSKPAASSPLQGAGLAETGFLRAVQQHAGAVGAAALSLAWHPDHGPGGRIQRPCLG